MTKISPVLSPSPSEMRGFEAISRCRIKGSLGPMDVMALHLGNECHCANRVLPVDEYSLVAYCVVQGYSKYDAKLDPTLPVSFFAAAVRFGHSLIPSAIERWSVTHQYVGARRLSEMLLRPFDVYQGGTCDQYLAGFMNQVSQAVDESMTQELTNHLFQEQQNNWGSDLASLNMQRGRDNGVPGYNAFREFCGLPRARHWDDLRGAFTNDTLKRYSEIYQSPDDIDLWSAGISERPIPGSMVGPVFGCIMGETFKNLRHGDRFWYEHSGWPSTFTPGIHFLFIRQYSI